MSLALEAYMRQIILSIFILCLSAMFEGCATSTFINVGRDKIVNDEKEPLWPVYSRTNYDLNLLYFPIWAFTPANDGKGDKAYATTYAVFFGPIMIVIGIVDLPISLIVDTGTLPWDIHDRNVNHESKDIPKEKTPIENNINIK